MTLLTSTHSLLQAATPTGKVGEPLSEQTAHLAAGRGHGGGASLFIFCLF